MAAAAIAGDAAGEQEQLLLHLKLAFLAREPPTFVLALARIIAEAELSSDIVIDGLYEEFGQFMSSKSLGSGVGLVGVCLNYVGASKVILTDGDASTLVNMKTNMEMNNLWVEQDDSQLLRENKNKVQCKYLSWEEASESDLWDCWPDIVLGADIIYDPVCVPHLIRVLSMLLRRGNNGGNNNVANKESSNEFSRSATEVPVAYIATVIRNVETFNCFEKAAADAKLSVVNITNSEAPLSLLPYMLSYDRSSTQTLDVDERGHVGHGEGGLESGGAGAGLRVAGNHHLMPLEGGGGGGAGEFEVDCVLGRRPLPSSLERHRQHAMMKLLHKNHKKSPTPQSESGPSAATIRPNPSRNWDNRRTYYLGGGEDDRGGGGDSEEGGELAAHHPKLLFQFVELWLASPLRLQEEEDKIGGFTGGTGGCGGGEGGVERPERGEKGAILILAAGGQVGDH
uniref:FAM86 N-terminal domain-containing protein n=1 Tax=Leersia perrieri TaxID=77586 RepID=A0A0D9WCM7_9ORYZ